MLGVKELCDRYDLKSRKSLYSRLEGLAIALSKDNGKSYATEEQVNLLDQQNEYLKNGGTIKNFDPIALSQVTVDSSNQNVPQALYNQELLLNITNAIASSMPPVDPLWYLGKLEIARASGWELTTAQVKALIGVKPSCPKNQNTFRRGSFIFIKSGKIGNSTAWKVQKVLDKSYRLV